MKQLGLYLMIFGVGSVVLATLDMNFTILLWIDLWGEDTAWAIRFIMAIVGFGLYIYGSDTEGEEAGAQG